MRRWIWLLACACSAQVAPPLGDQRFDAGSIDPPDTSPCNLTDPNHPPLNCPPTTGPSSCSTLEKVATCPADSACMAQKIQSVNRSSLRIGRLRLWKPDALLPLASLEIDSRVNARCANGGSETLSWLLRIDGGSLTTGSARPSVDGRTFVFSNEELAAPTTCAGFRGVAATIAPVTVPVARIGTGFSARIAFLNVAAGSYALPLRDVAIEVPEMSDPSCIGAWDRRWWCDGDSFGWTTAGRISAKLTVEEADRIPIQAAGCQSLCAILANDAHATELKVCKRGADGRIPEIGDACAGGGACRDAFQLVMTFGAYGIDLP